MKNLFKNIAIFFVVFSFAACSNDDVDFAPKSLEVTPHNISGYWKLTEYNGQKIPQGLFCYVEYIRKDRKFVMYQKFDSMYPRRITGVFSIEKDKYGKYILSGKYDYGMGEWNNKYFVTFNSQLLSNGLQIGNLFASQLFYMIHKMNDTLYLTREISSQKEQN